MVLILQHILIAVIQFFRRGQQAFLKADEPPSHSNVLQDALLSLGSVIDASSLREVVQEVLKEVIPKLESVFIYLLDTETGKLFCDNPPHELPPEGKAR
ncbi:PDE2A phosphodiesterase, partial [Polypterus senegalus]|nr:PDE2A phosphodiesterase [Polypterus senegalus]